MDHQLLWKVTMSPAWQAALRNAALMLVIYIGLDLVGVQLGWLHGVGWLGAVAAMIFVGWRSYARALKSTFRAPPSDR